MITRFRAKNYRALRDVGLSLGSFHVLVGPNGSGKSTLFDALAFLRDCLREKRPAPAIQLRAGAFAELTFLGLGGPIELYAEIDLGHLLVEGRAWRAAYRLVLEENPRGRVAVAHESLTKWPADQDLDAFARQSAGWEVLSRAAEDGRRVKLLREAGPFASSQPVANHEVFFFDEDTVALGHVPPDKTSFPTATAVREYLERDIRVLNPSGAAMAVPCSALSADDFEPDGRNLARVASRLLVPGPNGDSAARTANLEGWIEHLRLALPDLEGISWGQQEADRAEFLRLQFRNGRVYPSSWLSEGTLRMLGLTLPAFLPPRPGIHLVEEPENAVHPHALEVIVQALRSIPQAQVLLTTHSPLVVDLVGREALLVFSKEADEVRVQPGMTHPALRDWAGSPHLSALFSTGFLE